MKILAIYDNPRYLDRYTVVLDEKQRSGMYTMLGLDDTGGRWFSQFTEGQFYPDDVYSSLNKHLGEYVSIDDVPKAIRKGIDNRIEA